MKNKNWLILLGVSTGALIGTCIYKICKELDSLNVIDNDSFIDEDETFNDDESEKEDKIAKRKYFTIFPSKTKNSDDLDTDNECCCNGDCNCNCNCDCENSEECECKCDKEISEDFDKDLQLKINETFYCNYFNCEILKDYEEYINSFLDDPENENALAYVKRDKIFNVAGEFNVDSLKESFAKEYNNIKSIMASDIQGFAVLPMEAYPLETYLDEIDGLRTEEDVSRKVVGLLSYWVSISTSRGHSHIY